mmetsp:Transcript_29703/g.45019  ORF Transcript_29703/g.45019 Transcript_29703/m.45019 type:complete len:431 (-) Transcript_29703:480-1772(-)
MVISNSARYLFHPNLLASELNSNSTRYERFIAGPSKEDAHIMWIIWSSMSLSVAVFCITLFAGILASPKARKSAFNVYILFLVFPDIIFNVCCAMTCAINVVAGQYVSAVMCQWQSWYCVFDFTANSWMNAVVALELHRLLKDCRRGYHYRPPPIKKVVFRSLMVYVYSAFVASWTLFGFLPHRADVTAGLACLPVEFSIGSTIFFWLVFIPAFFGIPFAIFLHVCWDVHRKKMLPSNERTRQLFIFFMRLTLVFILMWLPTVVLLFAIGVPDVWASFVGGSWSHLQGLVSAAFCLTKADVRSAVVHFICCKSHELERDEDTSWFGVIRSSIIRRTSLMSRRKSSRLQDIHCKNLQEEIMNQVKDDSTESTNDDTALSVSVKTVNIPQTSINLFTDIEQPIIEDSIVSDDSRPDETGKNTVEHVDEAPPR